MRACFDTSIFVASIIPNHPDHTACRELLLKLKNSKEGILSTHTLAEIYATLSVHPDCIRLLSPSQLFQTIEDNLLKNFKVINLDAKDYQAALERVCDKQLRSGVIYDALHYQAALKAKAKSFYTLNTNDFERLSNGEIKISTP